MEDRYIILKRKIFIPPEVEPLQAPMGNKNVKNIMAKLPHSSILLFKKPEEVTTEIKLNAAYRIAVSKGTLFVHIRYKVNIPVLNKKK